MRGLSMRALALALVASASPALSQTPKAVATVGMIADVAANVAGPCVDIATLMGPGVDPHLYQPRAGDVRLLRGAALILYSGYHLEGRLGDVLDAFGAGTRTLAVAPESIDESLVLHTADGSAIDPHLWMDVSLWRRTVPTLASAQGELVPDCAEAMSAAADAYGRELEALHGWIEASVASVPEAQRVLVTAHDAFAYYGRAYGIDVHGIQGISTDAEAGIGDIRAVVDLVVDLGVPAVFVESTINPRTVQAVIDGAAARGHEVIVGGELFSDAMGAAGTPEGTYIGMLRANTMTIVTALGGTPAPWPEALAGWAAQWPPGALDD